MKKITTKFYFGERNRYNMKRAQSFTNGNLFNFELQVKRKNGKIHLKVISNNRSIYCNIYESTYKDNTNDIILLKAFLIREIVNSLEQGFNRLNNKIEKEMIIDSSNDSNFGKSVPITKKEKGGKFYSGKEGRYSIKTTESFSNGERFNFEIQVKRINGKIYLKEIYDNKSIYSRIAESVRYDTQSQIKLAKSHLVYHFVMAIEEGFYRLENPIGKRVIKNSSNDIEFKKAA